MLRTATLSLVLGTSQLLTGQFQVVHDVANTTTDRFSDEEWTATRALVDAALNA